jgi:hypothetical protein
MYTKQKISLSLYIVLRWVKYFHLQTGTIVSNEKFIIN